MSPKRRVELRSFLESDPVTRILESKHFGVRNALGESIGLGRPNQDVFAWPNQERWQIELRKPRFRPVPPHGLKVANDGSQRSGLPEALMHVGLECNRVDALQVLVGV